MGIIKEGRRRPSVVEDPQKLVAGTDFWAEFY